MDQVFLGWSNKSGQGAKGGDSGNHLQIDEVSGNRAATVEVEVGVEGSRPLPAGLLLG